MKERIVVEYGEVNKIAELMGCTNVMVSHALAFRKNSKLPVPFVSSPLSAVDPK